jgi:hypothetical protein
VAYDVGIFSEARNRYRKWVGFPVTSIAPPHVKLLTSVVELLNSTLFNPSTFLLSFLPCLYVHLLVHAHVPKTKPKVARKQTKPKQNHPKSMGVASAPFDIKRFYAFKAEALQTNR